VEYHFLNELRFMLSLVFSPESKNIASSLADNDDLAFSTIDTDVYIYIYIYIYIEESSLIFKCS
jgi:hypothetical protein